MRLKTWHVEGAVVWGALSGAVLVLGRADDWREWIAVAGVGFGFHHASVANRLEEAEQVRGAYDGPMPARVDCVKWLSRYWLLKEAAWVAYFVATGAVAPLIGCAVFILHPFWRRMWRRIHPRKS